MPLAKFKSRKKSITTIIDVVRPSIPIITNNTLPNHILVLGATGNLGTQVVCQALEASYYVTILVRNEKRLQFKRHHLRNPNLVILVGSVLSRDDLNRAIRDQDAVINCLGSRMMPSSEIKLCSKSQRIINQSMMENKVRRLIVVGCAENQKASRFQKFLGWFTTKGKLLADKVTQESIVKQDTEFIDWTIVRTGKLYDGELTNYRINEPFTMMKISRASVANFIIRELRTSLWLNKTPTISGFEKKSS
ncbi:NADP-binding protein [Gigaspora margarita]|uniref:NADP-binding protein n=1 Tax=Gigaspora margarita TaxID=4874 RepID=A0A8H3XLT2_GIGMA|nr:NADP-binding protein [Gigaspora margarita]